MQITLNGRAHVLEEGTSVVELVQALCLPHDGRGIAVAIDAAVVLRNRWAVTELLSGQRVDVLVATQGG